jgi:hypothetical protein
MWRKLVLVGIVFLAATVYFLPWKNLLEAKMKSELAAQGMEQLEFHIESVGLKEITFKDIAYGELKLPKLSISYTPYELLHGNFREIHASEITIHKDKLEIELQDVDASLISHEWQIKTINIMGAPVILPPLTGGGKIEFTDNKLALSGGIFSVDKKTSTSFKFDYSLNDKKSAILKIISATLPWNQGVLSAQNISVPIFSDAPIAFTLRVKQISLNELLASATSNRASATGVVSGTVPIIIVRDGTFTVKEANLKADKEGVLKLSPDVIPSDAPQVALLRDVLKDFHYSVFSMGVESADSKQLSMLLSLEGNNPDVYNGRVVKLNVHLTGDVIEMITQSLNILK